MELRGYQKEALAAITKAEAEGITRQLLVMATGLGKTFCVAKLMEQKKWPNIFGVMHREELLNQAAQTIRTLAPGVPVGVEKAGSFGDPASDRVILASVQTVGRKDKKRLSAVDPAWPKMVWIDESHHAPSGSYLTVVDHFGLYGEKPRRDALLIGTTATPDRLDEMGYDKIFDDVVFRYGLREGIRDKWLADIRAWRMETDLDLSNVKVRAGDFAENELAAAVILSNMNDVAAKTWSERCRGVRSLFFCVDKEHARGFGDRLKREGAKLVVLLDDTPAKERAAAVELFRLGELEALVNVGIATEGFDVPEIRAIHILRPTQSRALYTQMIGRGTRLASGKGYVQIYDYTSQRHDVCAIGQIFGLPNSWELEGQSVSEDADKLEEVEAELGLKIDGAKNIPDLIARVKGRRIELIRGALSDSGLPSKFAWSRPSQAVERWVISWRNPTQDGLSRIPEGYRAQAEEVIRKQNLWGVRERVEVFRNELGHYEATLHSDCNGLSKESKVAEHKSLTKLVSQIEASVKEQRPHQVTLLDKNRSWRFQPSSEPQRQLLKKKGVPESILSQLTKGEASCLINVPVKTIKAWFSEVV